MQHIGDDERRRRLAQRHALAPAHRRDDPVGATEAMTVLHATEAASVHLAVAARVEGVTAADVDAALYDDRTLVKQLAMRRTLFVFPRDLLPAAWASSGARTAEFERRKIVRDLIGSGVCRDGDAWLGDVRLAVLAELADGALSARDLRRRVPLIDRTVTVGPGTKWGAEVPLAPRILAWLGARGELVRGRNDGGWWVSRPMWARMEQWLGEPGSPVRPGPTRPISAGTSGVGEGAAGAAGQRRDGGTRSAGWTGSTGGTGSIEGASRGQAPGDAAGRTAPDEADGFRELIRRWLRTFGPGTETDIVWWLGATKTVVRRALGELAAVPVSLDSGAQGWVLPDDTAHTPAGPSWAALLPALDPTTMGWKERDFYLHPDDAPFLVDSAGNAGTTVWLDGRVVGCWIQDEDGQVQLVLRTTPTVEQRAVLDHEVARLSDWLGGRVVSSIYMARQRQGARLP